MRRLKAEAACRPAAWDCRTCGTTPAGEGVPSAMRCARAIGKRRQRRGDLARERKSGIRRYDQRVFPRNSVKRRTDMFPFTSIGDPNHAWLTFVCLAILGMVGVFGYVAVH